MTHGLDPSGMKVCGSLRGKESQPAEVLDESRGDTERAVMTTCYHHGTNYRNKDCNYDYFLLTCYEYTGVYTHTLMDVCIHIHNIHISSKCPCFLSSLIPISYNMYCLRVSI